MGNDQSVGIVCQFDRSYPLYFTDEVLSGVIHLPKKFNRIYIELVGEIGFVTNETVTNNTGETKTVNTNKFEQFFRQTVPYAECQQTHNGQVDIPFKAVLPAHLPPSLNYPKVYPNVQYHLQVVYDESASTTNKFQSFYFIVLPQVNLLSKPNLLVPSEFSNNNRKNVSLKCKMNKLGYLPGDIIEATLDIHNPEMIKIHKVTIKLTEINEINSAERKHEVLTYIVPEINETKDENMSAQLSMQIPQDGYDHRSSTTDNSLAVKYLAPSYHFEGGINQLIRITNKFTLKIDVGCSGLFTDFELSIPVTIGTESDNN
ncbi:unnamed protein product [Didymodactylos carnosus]|uniref:Arrestin C-terminal-like domain-containing protein n=1 Tax=Didymodactylos carnosus TaxID=1234261 RepID=A0A814CEK1_9BILA|nr:unnamed protein product [Didymodactylos carnosus]CAF1469038.1 unnamed protein product [Didymodactylos carnosus]CAF3716982.1 unnamed protein product [Didymodactylos carnosus]CAF4261294.1 unnamed protein product [Didymodactylos carnosus]